MNIYLKMNDLIYDITSVVDKSNAVKEIELEYTTEGEFDTGSFIIPSVKKNELGPHIDFSRTLIRNSMIIIEKDDIVSEWRIMGDVLKDNLNGTYTHTVNLIDRKSETVGYNLPGLTLTQPKSIPGSVHYSAFTMAETSKAETSWYGPHNSGIYYSVEHTGRNLIGTSTIPFTRGSEIETGDKTFIDGRILKVPGKKYQISLSFRLINTQINYSVKLAGFNQTFRGDYGVNSYTNFGITSKSKSISSVRFKVRINQGGTIIKETEWASVQYATTASRGFAQEDKIVPTEADISIPFDFTPTRAGSITADILIHPEDKFYRRNTMFNDPEGRDAMLTINNVSLVIKASTEETPHLRNLDWWVDKILNNTTSLNEEPIYKLSETSRGRLKEIISPEFTLDGYNLYQAIQEIADYLGVDWEVTSENEINFLFMDDSEVSDILTETGIQVYTGLNDLNEYMSYVKLKTSNIASNTAKKELQKETASGDGHIEQITTDNLYVPTEDEVNYIKSIKVKGISLTVPGITFTKNTEVDITDRILTKEEWDLLPGGFDNSSAIRQSGSVGFNKNNTLYFIRGSKGIHGLGYMGIEKPLAAFESGKVNRAFFETIVSQLEYKHQVTITTKDQGLSTTEDLMWIIEYYPFTSSEANIYKDDQSGFQIKRGKYFNESSKVNDPELIGSVSQNTVNRLGGTEYTITGYIDDLGSIPKLGTLNSQGRRLTKLSLQFTNSYIRYTATYIADYTKISKFVGLKSDYRLFEIPNTAIIPSTRIIKNRVVFGSTRTGTNTEKSMVATLANLKPKRADIAEVTVRKPNGETEKLYKIVSHNEFGKTASWKIEAESNYGWAYYNDKQRIDGTDILFRRLKQYTDVLGNISSVNITYGHSYNPIVSNKFSYPYNGSMTSLGLPNIFTEYDKDAREIFSIEHEFSFGTADYDKFRIYNMTKFNSMFTGEDDFEIKCRVLNYIPNRDDREVNLSKLGPEAGSVTLGSSTITIRSTVRSKGFVFYEANTNRILLVIKDDIQIGNNVYYYGLEKETNTFNVDFNSNNGSSVPNQIVPYGSLINEPVTNRNGYIFKGWYTNILLTNKFNFNTPITTDLILYAKWESIPTIKWKEVGYTTIINDSVTLEVSGYNCSINPRTYLGDPNNFPIGHTIRVMVYRECDPEWDHCLISGIDDYGYPIYGKVLCLPITYRVVNE